MTAFGILLAYLGLCLLPDLWIGALAWILGWVDESFWRQTLGFALVLGLVWLARRPLWRLAQAGWRRLRSSALAGLGGAGAVLWRVCAVPVALACVMQLVAVWELHVHDDPRWLPGVLKRILWQAEGVTRRSRRPSGDRPSA